METESEMPIAQQSPIELLECWTECIQSKADETYQDYITGKRETYLFTEDEFRVENDIAYPTINDIPNTNFGLDDF